VKSSNNLKSPQVESPQVENSPDKALYDYVLAQMKSGVDKSLIKTTLTENGWTDFDIDKVVGIVSRELDMGETLPPSEQLKQFTPSAIERFSVWLKEDWLVKLGAFLLIVAFGWFTTY